MHLSDGELKAWLDDALGASERARAEAHLSTCIECRRRAEDFKGAAERVQAHFAVFEGKQAMPNPEAALRRFQARYDSHEENSMLKRIFSKQLRPVWAVAAIAVLLFASFTLEPVRAFAGQFLGLFRVKNIEVITVDPTLLGKLGTNSQLGGQISQFLSASGTVTQKPTKPQLVADAKTASSQAGFTARLPGNRTDKPQLLVTGGSAFQFTVDRKRAQDILNQAGRSDLQLPASLDGATIKVTIPKGITAGYGTCPPLDQMDENVKPNGSAGRQMAGCIILADIPSPTVDTPPNLNVQQLAELGLQFSGMSAQQAHSFAQTVDWTSTLVVPIPRNAATYKQVQVDGVAGYLIQRPVDDAPEFSLIWVKNGIIYAIGGLSSNSDAAIQMANSMK